MHFFFEELLFFFLVKVNVRVRVRVRVSIRVRMRVRVSIRVRMRVRNGQFLNWSITALGVKGLCAASASMHQCRRQPCRRQPRASSRHKCYHLVRQQYLVVHKPFFVLI